jgi:hypothetical protein
MHFSFPHACYMSHPPQQLLQYLALDVTKVTSDVSCIPFKRVTSSVFKLTLRGKTRYIIKCQRPSWKQSVTKSVFRRQVTRVSSLWPHKSVRLISFLIISTASPQYVRLWRPHAPFVATASQKCLPTQTEEFGRVCRGQQPELNCPSPCWIGGI